MASFAFGRTLLQLAGRLGLKPADLTKVDDITFIGTGNKGLLTNTKLAPNVINSNKIFKSNLDLTDDTFMNLRSSVSLFNKGKLNPIEERILMDNISDLVRFKETGSVLKKGGIITTETFRDLYRKGAPGSAFKELGKRLSKQKKNRFPGNVTPEVKSALKDIDNQIVASGQITMKDFAKLSEIEKNRIRRIFDPELEAKFPFLKFAEGGVASLDKPKRGLVDEPGSYAGKTLFGDIAEIDIGESLKQTGSGFLNLFSPSQIMELLSGAGEGFKQIFFNLKSNAEKEDLLKEIIGNQYAKGGMVKDKGLANILQV